MSKPVALYLRKSREDSEGRAETLRRHETMLHDYCKRNGLQIGRVYCEVASGESIASRPEMRRLMEDVSTGIYEGVVCVDIERLSRGNPVDQCDILDTFKDSCTKIYTLNKTYDLSSEEIDEEYFEFSLFMSRREYKMIRRRMLRGRLQATKDGYFTGSVLPYGYAKRREKGGYVLVPDANESEVVRKIFELYIGGERPWTIAKALNERGLTTRNGMKWHDYTIDAIVKNRNHIGEVRSKKHGRWVPGRHVGIIDRDTFELAQSLRITPKAKCGRSNRVANPLASLVRCSKCGYVMQRNVNSAGVAYLVCKRPYCDCRGAKLADIENALVERLREELAGFMAYATDYEEEARKRRDSMRGEVKALNEELERRSGMLEHACELLEQGLYSPELFKARSESLGTSIKELKARIAELESRISGFDEGTRSAIPKIEKVLEVYDSLTAEKRNSLLKTIVEKVTYDDSEGGISLDVVLLV